MSFTVGFTGRWGSYSIKDTGLYKVSAEDYKKRLENFTESWSKADNKEPGSEQQLYKLYSANTDLVKYLYKFFGIKKENVNFTEARQLMRLLTDEGALYLLDNIGHHERPVVLKYLLLREMYPKMAREYFKENMAFFKAVVSRFDPSFASQIGQELSSVAFEKFLSNHFKLDSVDVETKLFQKKISLPAELKVLEQYQQLSNEDKKGFYEKNEESIITALDAYNKIIVGNNAPKYLPRILRQYSSYKKQIENALKESPLNENEKNNKLKELLRKFYNDNEEIIIELAVDYNKICIPKVDVYNLSLKDIDLILQSYLPGEVNVYAVTAENVQDNINAVYEGYQKYSQLKAQISVNNFLKDNVYKKQQELTDKISYLLATGDTKEAAEKASQKFLFYSDNIKDYQNGAMSEEAYQLLVEDLEAFLGVRGISAEELKSSTLFDRQFLLEKLMTVLSIIRKQNIDGDELLRTDLYSSPVFNKFQKWKHAKGEIIDPNVFIEKEAQYYIADRASKGVEDLEKLLEEPQEYNKIRNIINYLTPGALPLVYDEEDLQLIKTELDKANKELADNRAGGYSQLEASYIVQDMNFLQQDIVKLDQFSVVQDHLTVEQKEDIKNIAQRYGFDTEDPSLLAANLRTRLAAYYTPWNQYKLINSAENMYLEKYIESIKRQYAGDPNISEEKLNEIIQQIRAKGISLDFDKAYAFFLQSKTTVQQNALFALLTKVIADCGTNQDKIEAIFNFYGGAGYNFTYGQRMNIIRRDYGDNVYNELKEYLEKGDINSIVQRLGQLYPANNGDVQLREMLDALLGGDADSSLKEKRLFRLAWHFVNSDFNKYKIDVNGMTFLFKKGSGALTEIDKEILGNFIGYVKLLEHPDNKKVLAEIRSVKKEDRTSQMLFPPADIRFVHYEQIKAEGKKLFIEFYRGPDINPAGILYETKKSNDFTADCRENPIAAINRLCLKKEFGGNVPAAMRAIDIRLFADNMKSILQNKDYQMLLAFADALEQGMYSEKYIDDDISLEVKNNNKNIKKYKKLLSEFKRITAETVSRALSDGIWSYQVLPPDKPVWERVLQEGINTALRFTDVFNSKFTGADSFQINDRMMMLRIGLNKEEFRKMVVNNYLVLRYSVVKLKELKNKDKLSAEEKKVLRDVLGIDLVNADKCGKEEIEKIDKMINVFENSNASLEQKYIDLLSNEQSAKELAEAGIAIKENNEFLITDDKKYNAFIGNDNGILQKTKALDRNIDLFVNNKGLTYGELKRFSSNYVDNRNKNGWQRGMSSFGESLMSTMTAEGNTIYNHATGQILPLQDFNKTLVSVYMQALIVTLQKSMLGESPSLQAELVHVVSYLQNFINASTLSFGDYEKYKETLSPAMRQYLAFCEANLESVSAISSMDVTTNYKYQDRLLSEHDAYIPTVDHARDYIRFFLGYNHGLVQCSYADIDKVTGKNAFYQEYGKNWIRQIVPFLTNKNNSYDLGVVLKRELYNSDHEDMYTKQGGISSFLNTYENGNICTGEQIEKFFSLYEKKFLDKKYNIIWQLTPRSLAELLTQAPLIDGSPAAYHVLFAAFETLSPDKFNKKLDGLDADAKKNLDINNDKQRYANLYKYYQASATVTVNLSEKTKDILNKKWPPATSASGIIYKKIEKDGKITYELDIRCKSLDKLKSILESLSDISAADKKKIEEAYNQRVDRFKKILETGEQDPQGAVTKITDLFKNVTETKVVLNWGSATLTPWHQEYRQAKEEFQKNNGDSAKTYELVLESTKQSIGMGSLRGMFQSAAGMSLDKVFFELNNSYATADIEKSSETESSQETATSTPGQRLRDGVTEKVSEALQLDFFAEINKRIAQDEKLLPQIEQQVKYFSQLYKKDPERFKIEFGALAGRFAGIAVGESLVWGDLVDLLMLQGTKQSMSERIRIASSDPYERATLGQSGLPFVGAFEIPLSFLQTVIATTILMGFAPAWYTNVAESYTSGRDLDALAQFVGVEVMIRKYGIWGKTAKGFGGLWGGVGRLTNGKYEGITDLQYHDNKVLSKTGKALSKAETYISKAYHFPTTAVKKAAYSMPFLYSERYALGGWNPINKYGIGGKIFNEFFSDVNIVADGTFGVAKEMTYRYYKLFYKAGEVITRGKSVGFSSDLTMDNINARLNGCYDMPEKKTREIAENVLNDLIDSPSANTTGYKYFEDIIRDTDEHFKGTKNFSREEYYIQLKKIAKKYKVSEEYINEIITEAETLIGNRGSIRRKTDLLGLTNSEKVNFIEKLRDAHHNVLKSKIDPAINSFVENVSKYSNAAEAVEQLQKDIKEIKGLPAVVKKEMVVKIDEQEILEQINPRARIRATMSEAILDRINVLPHDPTAESGLWKNISRSLDKENVFSITSDNSAKEAFSDGLKEIRKEYFLKKYGSEIDGLVNDILKDLLAQKKRLRGSLSSEQYIYHCERLVQKIMEAGGEFNESALKEFFNDVLKFEKGTEVAGDVYNKIKIKSEQLVHKYNKRIKALRKDFETNYKNILNNSVADAEFNEIAENYYARKHNVAVDAGDNKKIKSNKSTAHLLEELELEKGRTEKINKINGLQNSAKASLGKIRQQLVLANLPEDEIDRIISAIVSGDDSLTEILGKNKDLLDDEIKRSFKNVRSCKKEISLIETPRLKAIKQKIVSVTNKTVANHKILQEAQRVLEKNIVNGVLGKTVLKVGQPVTALINSKYGPLVVMVALTAWGTYELLYAESSDNLKQDPELVDELATQGVLISNFVVAGKVAAKMQLKFPNSFKKVMGTPPPGTKDLAKYWSSVIEKNPATWQKFIGGAKGVAKVTIAAAMFDIAYETYLQKDNLMVFGATEYSGGRIKSAIGKAVVSALVGESAAAIAAGSGAGTIMAPVVGVAAAITTYGVLSYRETVSVAELYQPKLNRQYALAGSSNVLEIIETNGTDNSFYQNKADDVAGFLQAAGGEKSYFDKILSQRKENAFSRNLKECLIKKITTDNAKLLGVFTNGQTLLESVVDDLNRQKRGVVWQNIDVRLVGLTPCAEGNCLTIKVKATAADGKIIELNYQSIEERNDNSAVYKDGMLYIPDKRKRQGLIDYKSNSFLVNVIVDNKAPNKIPLRVYEPLTDGDTQTFDAMFRSFSELTYRLLLNFSAGGIFNLAYNEKKRSLSEQDIAYKANIKKLQELLKSGKYDEVKEFFYKNNVFMGMLLKRSMEISYDLMPKDDLRKFPAERLSPEMLLAFSEFVLKDKCTKMNDAILEHKDKTINEVFSVSKNSELKEVIGSYLYKKVTESADKYFSHGQGILLKANNQQRIAETYKKIKNENMLFNILMQGPGGLLTYFKKTDPYLVVTTEDIAVINTIEKKLLDEINIFSSQKVSGQNKELMSFYKGQAAKQYNAQSFAASNSPEVNIYWQKFTRGQKNIPVTKERVYGPSFFNYVLSGGIESRSSSRKIDNKSKEILVKKTDQQKIAVDFYETGLSKLYKARREQRRTIMGYIAKKDQSIVLKAVNKHIAGYTEIADLQRIIGLIRKEPGFPQTLDQRIIELCIINKQTETLLAHWESNKNLLLGYSVNAEMRDDRTTARVKDMLMAYEILIKEHSVVCAKTGHDYQMSMRRKNAGSYSLGEQYSVIKNIVVEGSGQYQKEVDIKVAVNNMSPIEQMEYLYEKHRFVYEQNGISFTDFRRINDLLLNGALIFASKHGPIDDDFSGWEGTTSDNDKKLADKVFAIMLSLAVAERKNKNIDNFKPALHCDDSISEDVYDFYKYSGLDAQGSYIPFKGGKEIRLSGEDYAKLLKILIIQ